MNVQRAFRDTTNNDFPLVLPVRERASVMNRILKKRLESVLPVAMREAGLDMYLVICQEDDLDPAFTTLIPVDTWCPILQMLIFYDRGEEAGVERINLSMTDTGELYDRPWNGRQTEEQWRLLAQIVEQRAPQRIGVNTGAVQWAAGGLTHNLYTQLVHALPSRYVDRLESAEPLVTRWLSTLTGDELELYTHVVDVARHLIGMCYSHGTIVPGVTTTKDLEWAYWQHCADLGLSLAFKPFFNLIRSQKAREMLGTEDNVVRPGDFIHCDVGIRYLGLNSDHQQMAYVLRAGETEAPAGARALLAEVNHLQDIFMATFEQGRSGNELLADILGRARREGVPNPKVYSHSLGLFLHEPGPLIGLPWEQERCPGRGDVQLQIGNCFTMELSACDRLPEWQDEEMRLPVEEDVAFTAAGCHVIRDRQTAFYLI
jgi:Xaa-Pro aminopeptidase